MTQDMSLSRSSDNILSDNIRIRAARVEGASEWTVMVKNSYNIRRTFCFRLIGLNATWLIMEPPELSIEEGKEGKATLKLPVPTNRDEEMTFDLAAWCRDEPAQTAKVPLKTVAHMPKPPRQMIISPLVKSRYASNPVMSPSNQEGRKTS